MKANKANKNYAVLHKGQVEHLHNNNGEYVVVKVSFPEETGLPDIFLDVTEMCQNKSIPVIVDEIKEIFTPTVIPEYIGESFKNNKHLIKDK